jgi:hypothetical protein
MAQVPFNSTTARKEDALSSPDRTLRGESLETVYRNELRLVYLLIVQLRNGAGNGITGRSAVRVKLTGAQRNKFGLVMHVLATTAQDGESRRCKQQPRYADLCRTINTAPP